MKGPACVGRTIGVGGGSMGQRTPSRIFTIHRTAVYVDPASGELRHGAVGSRPVNAGLVVDGTRGRFVYESVGGPRPVACGPDGSRAVEPAAPGGPAGTVFDVVAQEWGGVGLAADGKYLCAEPDGRLTLSRPHCEAWERFVPSDPPRSLGVFEALGLLTPYDIPGMAKRRYGRRRDGGYVLLGDLQDVDAVFSLGIGDEVTFDLELARLGKTIFMFDHTVEGPPVGHANFRFFRQEIAGQSDAAAGRHSVVDLVQRLGCAGRRDLLLKIDIEGGEYEVFAATPRDTLRQFRQITMEIHGLLQLGDAAFRTRFVAAMARLNDDFTLYHVHANNSGALGFVDGFPMADVLELSYLRSDIASRAPSATLYPTALDYANWPPRPDCLLWFYPFLPAAAGDRGRLLESVALANRLLAP